MDRRLQYTMALLFLLFHSTAASDDNLTISYVDYPSECTYSFLTPGGITPDNVSLTAPGIHPGNYESYIVSSPENRITRDIFIYWENYLKCRGEVQFRYKAYYLIRTKYGDIVKIHADVVYRNYAIFTKLRYDVAYNFEVISIDKNDASDLSLIYVPSDTDKTKPNKPLWLKKALLFGNVFTLWWENPYNQHSIRFHRSNQYILHWCESEPESLGQCSGKMNTMPVPITQSRRRITVEDSKKNYQFAISAEMVTGNVLKSSVGSGLQWEECSLPKSQSDVIIIKKLWFTAIGSTFIGLRWKIDCSTMSEYFAAYQIYYCPVISYTNLKCKEKLALKFLGKFPQNNTIPIAIIPNLKPSTLYMFSVDILTRVDSHLGVRFRTNPHFQRTSHK